MARQAAWLAVLFVACATAVSADVATTGPSTAGNNRLSNNRSSTLTIIHYAYAHMNGSSFSSAAGLMATLQRALLAYPHALLLNPTGHLGKRLWIQHDASAPNLADIVSDGDLAAADTDPLLAANVRIPGRARLRASEVRAVTGGGGPRVGIVGYVPSAHQKTPEVTRLGALVSDPVSAVRLEARRLRGNGVPLVVALGNAGFPEDQLVASRVEEVNVVVAAEGDGDGYPLALQQEAGRLVPLLQAPPDSVCVTTLLFDSQYQLVDYGGFRLPISEEQPLEGA